MAATRAERILSEAGITARVRTYEAASGDHNFGDEAVALTGLPAPKVFKTLVVDAAGELIFALVPVAARLDLKVVARARGAKKARLAERTAAERATGYVMGGITAIGSTTALPCFIDDSARTQPTIIVSAGQRGRNLEVDPAALARLLDAQFAPLAATGR
ncbi:hypothetical protein BSZ39_00850 [Bowdeniella nasicola]|uniref:Cys-tRNA(Pro)/Cys-tRNA(Cys) deacylase n=1 Tax=Bowdeniella nasicola TaxID=208480 RepID=A0A1Q5Q661_9ACTO|nr:aminoacyl-tRNA deacylase [Bowdeniella nasicola]OKL55110.1 hypothetical protein BSZ39_00850 [Bowdeniella nasicola]